MGLCRLPRTVCESVGERWRDGSGSLLILGYPVTPMLAHTLARVVDAVDRSTIEKRRRDCARGRAQSASVSASDGATRQAVCSPLVCGHTEARTHVGAVGRRDRFSTVEKRSGENRAGGYRDVDACAFVRARV